MRVLLASWAYPPVTEGGLEVVPVDGTTAEIYDALTAGAITRAG